MAKAKPRILNIVDINSNFRRVLMSIPVHINYFEHGTTKTGDKSYREIEFIFCKLRNGDSPKWCIYDFKFIKTFMNIDVKFELRKEYNNTRKKSEGSYKSGYQAVCDYIDSSVDGISSNNIESIHFNNRKQVNIDGNNYNIPINIDINIRDIGMRKYKIFNALN